MELQIEDKFILSAIKINPSKEELGQMDQFLTLIKDWEYLAKTAIEGGIGPLIFKKLPLLENAKLVPEPTRKNLHHSYLKTLTRSLVLYEHFQNISQTLSSENIPAIALKGIYLSESLYKDIGLRQLSDIDLLVKEGDGQKCLEILSELGYKPHNLKKSNFFEVNTETVHFAPMVLNGVFVETHVKLHKKSESYHVDIKELWNNALRTEIKNSPIYVMDDDHLLIHICIHLDKHFRTGHLQLTCYCDVTNILCEFKDRINWKRVEELCSTYHCTNNVFKHLILSNAYIKAPLPNDIILKYKSLLNKEASDFFIKHLRRKSIDLYFNTTPHNIDNIKQVKGFKNKMVYVFHDTFPPKDFMIKQYKIKHKSLYRFYYPYRISLGILKLFIHAKKTLTQSKT